MGCLAADLRAEPSADVRRWQETFEKEVLPIVRDHCFECHRGDDADAGFDIAQFQTGAAVTEQADVWEEVGKRIRLNEMPPEGSPGLNDQQKAIFHRWLDARPASDDCQALATDETQAWYRGYVMSRRLTRTEYRNALRDVVGVSLNASIELPSDGAGGEGFDTAGDSLFTSAIHIERYLAAASDVIDRVVGGTARTDADSNAAIRDARERLFGPVEDPAAMQRADVSDVVRRFARRAWRRPVSDDEVQRLMHLYDARRDAEPRHDAAADVETALRGPLKAALVSPHFLFVVETESAEGGVQKLTSHQLATRLALFLWSSVPDEALLAAADAGQLETDQQVLAQTRRMLADPKARALGENFGMQWLGLTHFRSSTRPDAEVYPEYNTALSEDLYEEAIRTVAAVFTENRSVMDLIDADWVFANGRLAQHYELSLSPDAPWQRVSLEDRRRGGVMTLGAVLMASSYPRRTSPVLRGHWILEQVLGSRVPPPPPGVPALEETAAASSLSQRERLEQHRRDPACSSCHNRMDPLGFGLENFDGLGRWRETDAGHPIDASGKLPNGDTFRGPEELKQTLRKRAGEFKKHVSRKMLGFALGRKLNRFDDCVVEDCLEALDARDQNATAIIETIVTSYPFQHRYFKAAK